MLWTCDCQAPRNGLKAGGRGGGGGGRLKSSGSRKNGGIRLCPRIFFKLRPLNIKEMAILEDMPCKILHPNWKTDNVTDMLVEISKQKLC